MRDGVAMCWLGTGGSGGGGCGPTEWDQEGPERCRPRPPSLPSFTACVLLSGCLPPASQQRVWACSLPSPLWILLEPGWLLAGTREALWSVSGARRWACPLSLSWPQSQKCMALGHLCFLLTRWEPGKQCQNQLCLQILAETTAHNLCPVFPNLYLSFRSRGWSRAADASPPSSLADPRLLPASIAPSPTCDRTAITFT